MKDSTAHKDYKHLVQELREPKLNQVKFFPRKSTAKSKKSDHVYVRVAKTCPILDNVSRQNLSEKSEASLSTSSGCSVASIRTEDSKITVSKDGSNGQYTPIVAKLPQDGTTRGSSSGSQLSTKSSSSLDTLALTELEIWSEIDRRLVEEVQEDGDIKKYFLPEFRQDLITQ